MLDSTHIGETVEIVVYAIYQPLDAVADISPLTYMLDETGDVLLWDGDLVPFEREVILETVRDVPIYQGALGAGTLNISFGYRFQDGMLIQNLEPIEVVITE